MNVSSQAIGANHKEVEDCFTEMLSKWLHCSSSPELDWKDLLEALENEVVDRKDLALNIKEQLHKWGKYEHILNTVLL